MYHTDEERRRNERAWNDPPMFSYDQLNKQPASAVPLNKRYKYPIADQQALNNQMYQGQQGYMQGNYMQGGLYQQQQQQPYSQSVIGQQPYSAAAAGSTLGYNQPMMNAYPGQSALQQQANYGYGQQQHYAQASPYQTSLAQQPLSSAAYGAAGQAQLAGQTALGGQVGLTNQPAVSQAMASNQLNYQTAQQQSSAYLPNVQNTLNASLASQLPASSQQSMMQTAAGGYSMPGQQYGQQAMYGQQTALGQQQQLQQQQYNTQLQNQYQQQNY